MSHFFAVPRSIRTFSITFVASLAVAHNAFNKGYLLAANRDALIAQAVASDVCN